MSPCRLAWAWVGVVAAACAVDAAPVGPCPGTAAISVVADNRSADGTVVLAVSGERVASSGTCDETGSGFALSYDALMTCNGAGVVRCGRVEGLAPGLWVHRVSLQVVGSPPQVQAQSSMLVGADGGTYGSNVVQWTVYPRTFVVTQATRADLLAQLDAARALATAGASPALVRFDRAAFPGAALPTTIALQTPGSCPLRTCSADGRKTAYCFEGSGVTIDALDADARPGGIVLTAGTCNNSLFRIYGSDNVFRGLTLQGSSHLTPSVATDTIALTGATTRRNRFEQCTIVGPTLGDAVSVEGDAGTPDGRPAPEIVIVESEVRDAEDKGVKVSLGGVARVERSCVHDNANGGVQATLGGTATVIESVVQHNVGGGAENGLLVGVPGTVGAANSLTTLGNVVRFNGARGVSVVNAATAVLTSDVVAENYQAGIRIETTLAGIQPQATVRGTTFACNFAAGLCTDEIAQACRLDEDCNVGCAPGMGFGTARGFGAVLAACTNAGCMEPSVDFGPGGDDVGRNAFTLNPNPNAPDPGGVNFSTALTSPAGVPAAGNQWEHCDTPDPPIVPNKCYVEQVAMLDVRLAVPDATSPFLGLPIGPRHGPAPVVTAISPLRPRAGELVRVYGGNFNAIDGVVCHPPGVPDDRCSAANPAIVARNDGNPSQGNHVTIEIDGQVWNAEVHEVAPSMLMFRMPVDCFAPALLHVARGNDPALAPVELCDPTGCDGRPVGTPCDDGDACTSGDVCTAFGTCEGPPIDCQGPCLTGACDPASGCLPRVETTSCDDGDTCTESDHCSGVDGTCVAGASRSCSGPCETGACDPVIGCLAVDPVVACDDGVACTDETCDPVLGCGHTPRAGVAGIRCHFTQLRALLESLPAALAPLERKLRRRVGCAERHTSQALAASAGSRRGRRQAQRALRCLKRYRRMAEKTRRLAEPERIQLGREGKLTAEAVAAFFAIR